VDACLAVDPIHQEGLALRAVLLRELGREEDARWLCDYETLVRAVDLEPPAGFDDIESFNTALCEYVLRHPSLAPDPYGSSTRGGRHSGELTAGEVARLARLALFPSYSYHGTVPFECEGTRISIAVDLMPGR
jgi:hypothetical protein